MMPISLLASTQPVASLGFTVQHFWWAIFVGGLSAVSLPLGSALGLLWQPRPKIVAFMTAFGAGALIAALSVELVAPAAMALIPSVGHAVPEEARGHLMALIGGAIVGGVLFLVLDQLINAKGGFLRKGATSIAYMSKAKNRRNAEILHALSKVRVLQNVPPEYVEHLVRQVRLVPYQAGEIVVQQGETGDRMFFLESGAVAVKRDGETVKTLTEGDVLGEIALVAGVPRTASAVAETDLKVLSLWKKDFDHLRRLSPELDQATTNLAAERLDELRAHDENRALQAHAWASKAVAALRDQTEVPTPHELRQAKKDHGGAPLAIWLGILLDGIPESFVIGASLLAVLSLKASLGMTDGLTLTAVIPYTLVAGLFLSNFPEAMSSSIGMRTQGWGAKKVFFMWLVLCVMTALGAGVGYALGGSAPHGVVLAVEGMAAGAMLTMIAQAMIPEAMHLGGPNVTGISTLAGFLSAVAFKLLE